MVKRTRVLVVEDEPIVALSIRHTLQQWKCDATVVASGEDALACVDRIDPAVVLMDIKLKGALDGIETGRRICQRCYRPIIFLTAYADAEIAARINAVGCHCGYLSKPFDDSELKSAIERALQEKRPR